MQFTLNSVKIPFFRKVEKYFGFFFVSEINILILNHLQILTNATMKRMMTATKCVQEFAVTPLALSSAST